MVLREAATAVAVTLPFGLGLSAAGAGADDPEPEFRFQDPEIVESSGLAVVDGLVVTVNDSGDAARVFTVDPASGRTVGVTRWQGEVDDVEALAPAGGSEVWVGDIGDNGASRDTIAVFRVPVGRGEREVTAPRYRFRYPDGGRDAETLLAEPGTDRLYVVTKSVFGAEVYAAPEQLREGEVHRLEHVAGVQPRAKPIVTDGAFLPGGDRLVLRNYGSATAYGWPGLEELGDFRLPSQQQGEGVAADGPRTLLTSSEGLRAPVFRVPLPEEVRAPETASPDPGPADGAEQPDGSRSREGEELPEASPGPRDPTQWLIGTGVLVVALLVLWRALRPR